ncbi:ATP-dependent DNA helicase [Aerosakkonemataceae cyanobacterium BLCC-F50]|uniref:ATP-dependent DNA helicase n=1 Tax=Floridaenema flaviceps BLCC-F50 TaxID=3153642 RepID=A0ABV4Y421_9CYAN
MIEVEVHNSLRAFLRECKETYWPHHLTMARLVARALRLERSALIQVGAPTSANIRYRLSYLAPALMWSGPVIVVATEATQQRLLKVEIPQLQGWLTTEKEIFVGDALPDPNFAGLLITSPSSWLRSRLTTKTQFGHGIPTILDGVDDLETWTRQQLTATITPSDWEELIQAFPHRIEAIRDAKVQLTKEIFQHPANPYECYLLEVTEKQVLSHLFAVLSLDQEDSATFSALPPSWQTFCQRFTTPGQMYWAQIARTQGLFTIYCGPIEVSSTLKPIWIDQPVVLIGGALELEAEAPIYRQQLGLGDLTCLKFSLDRQSELIQLYVPDSFPLPNTPQFQAALLQEIRRLLVVSTVVEGLTVLLVSDVPLKAQVGAEIAAEFGSRVQVEKTCLDDNGILVTGWEFWLEHQDVLPAPHLLLIATLPIPSLENPLVAGRVAAYKQQHQDWFRLYLLPEALNVLQRAIAPVRTTQGVVALLDSRTIHRSYGQQVLTALSPFARINYLDPNLFASEG